MSRSGFEITVLHNAVSNVPRHTQVLVVTGSVWTFVCVYEHPTLYLYRISNQCVKMLVMDRTITLVLMKRVEKQYLLKTKK